MSTWLSPILANLHLTFASIPPRHSTIGESQVDIRQYTPWTFANNWRKSYWRRSGAPKFRLTFTTLLVLL
jgi:hypothetical protein